MRIGLIVPQGWVGEYDGWDPQEAWQRTVAVARQADRLGFESIWLFDHFHTIPRPKDEITFESFTSLSALAALTERVRIGHIVICTGFRNPALTAKMISTMDTISGGRMELGIGAGWKRDEWEAYGYPFPETRERLARLARRPRGHRRDAGRGSTRARDVRGRARSGQGCPQRPQADPASAGPDHGRRQRSGRDLAAGRATGGRAQSRRDDASRGRRRVAGHSRSLRGDRPRPGEPAGLAPRLAGAHRGTAAPSGWTCSARIATSACRGSWACSSAPTRSDEAAESLATDARAAGLELSPPAAAG